MPERPATPNTGKPETGRRKIEVEITVNTAEFEKQMRKVRRDIAEAAEAFRRMNDVWERGLRRRRRLSRSRIRWYWRLWYRLVDWHHRRDAQERA